MDLTKGDEWTSEGWVVVEEDGRPLLSHGGPLILRSEAAARHAERVTRRADGRERAVVLVQVVVRIPPPADEAEAERATRLESMRGR